jgi:hypothetical protein
MISSIELYLRSSAIGQHRRLGVVSVEHGRTRLAPHEDIEYWCTGRRIRACITSIHQRGGQLPCVYADEVTADELVG